MPKIIGTPGDDILVNGYYPHIPALMYGGAGNDEITGGLKDDVLCGDEGDDKIYGLGGRDIIEGGAGADEIYGGSNVDTAAYENSDAGVTIDLEFGTASGGHAKGDVLHSIENLTGSRFADQLSGDANANVLSGGGGGDRLFGRNGDDTLEGGAGRDYLDGGKDTDTASYASSSGSVKINLATGYAAGGDAEGDILKSIENLTGSAHNDLLAGNSFDNILDGGAGDDTILGGGGGTDTYIGGDGIDTLSFAGLSHGILASLLGGLAIEDLNGDLSDAVSAIGGEPIHSFSGFENLEGSNSNDYLEGDANDNTISGGAGNDEIKGRHGNDQLFGGTGNDTILGMTEDDLIEGGAGGDDLNGGSGIDTLSYKSSNTAVSVNLQTNTASGGHAEGDTILGFENLTGSAHGDVLIGSSGSNAGPGMTADNTIEGGAGDDIIRGGGGLDQLWGGAGNDRFVLDASDSSVFLANVEIIHDFVAGGSEDAIDLSNAGTDYDSIEDVLAHAQSVMTEDGQAALELDFGPSGTVVLIGVDAGQLTESDFIF